jgi:DNA-3-methyladenine glycosylase
VSTPELDLLVAGDVLAVAEGLLGWTLLSEIDGEVTSVTITETEAYAGPDDPASHAFRGMTPRNKAMFGEAGTLYVYRSYGIHWCMNVVVGNKSLPHAVLLRGGDADAGIEVMVARRGRKTNLADGPGKLCQALGVNGEMDGCDLRSDVVRLRPGPGLGGRTIMRTPRIGISEATERPWRFVAVS